MCHFLALAGQPEMMHKNFMHQHLRIFVVQRSCMKFYACSSQSPGYSAGVKLVGSLCNCCNFVYKIRPYTSRKKLSNRYGLCRSSNKINAGLVTCNKI